MPKLIATMLILLMIGLLLVMSMDYFSADVTDGSMMNHYAKSVDRKFEGVIGDITKFFK